MLFVKDYHASSYRKHVIRCFFIFGVNFWGIRLGHIDVFSFSYKIYYHRDDTDISVAMWGTITRRFCITSHTFPQPFTLRPSLGSSSSEPLPCLNMAVQLLTMTYGGASSSYTSTMRSWLFTDVTPSFFKNLFTVRCRLLKYSQTFCTASQNLTNSSSSLCLRFYGFERWYNRFSEFRRPRSITSYFRTYRKLLVFMSGEFYADVSNEGSGGGVRLK